MFSDSSSRGRPPVLGVFAGGAGRRMGGADKAQLSAPDGRGMLLLRWLQLGEALGLRCVVAGARPFWQGRLPAEQLLVDEPPGIGPLGGLAALLRHAGPRPALAVACDMPYVDLPLLRVLVQTPAAGAVLAPRDPASGKWQPLFARYDSPRVYAALQTALARDVRSFQALFATLQVQELALDETQRRKLTDWDRPQDLFLA